MTSMLRRHRLGSIALVATVTSCLASPAVPCGEGVCPSNTTCHEPTGSCIPAGCGDGEVAGAEECDGANLAGHDCRARGYYERDGLACSPRCTLDETACTGRCGDHAANGAEVCDGAPPEGQSCLDFGFDVGRLACTSACSPGFATCAPIGWHAVGGGGVRPLSAIWGDGATDVFAVGKAGRIVHFDGVSWSAMTPPSSVDLQGVWGSSATDVFAVGAGGTILHFDGTTWTAMSSPTTASLRAVWGRAADDVYAVGGAPMEDATILHYDGAQWTATQIAGASTLQGVYGAGAHVVAVGLNNTIVHKDGAAAWALVAAPAVASLDATDPSIAYHLFAVSGTGASLVAVGGASGGSAAQSVVLAFDGASWTSLASPFTADLYAVWGTSPSAMLVGGSAGKLFELAGSTLIPKDSGTTRSISGLWGTSIDHVLATTSGGFVQGTDGIEWSTIEHLGVPSAALTGVWRYANGDRMVVGTGGQILSVQGGVATPVAHDGTAVDMQAIWDSSDTLGAGTTFVASQGAGVFRRPPSHPTFTHAGLPGGVYADIWGTSDSNVYAVGGGAGATGMPQLRRWNGAAWSTAAHPAISGTRYLGVWGSGPNDVFVVGTQARVLHSADGQTFTAFTDAEIGLDPSVTLRAVWGTGPTDVYVAGDAGTILHYDGARWRPMTTQATDLLTTIAGVGRHDVFAAGTGTLLHFDGVSWSRMALPVAFNALDLFVAPDALTVVGIDATVATLRRACAGPERACGDAWDNDCDGAVNCADPDCEGTAACERGGACEIAAELACNASRTGTTYTGISRIDELPCTARALGGSEVTYRLVAPAQGEVTIALAEVAGDAELVVLEAEPVRSACDVAACTAATGGSITLPARGQTVYVHIDAPAAGGAEFTLTTSCP